MHKNINYLIIGINLLVGFSSELALKYGFSETGISSSN
jgi:hypothetical protein